MNEGVEGGITKSPQPTLRAYKAANEIQTTQLQQLKLSISHEHLQLRLKTYFKMLIKESYADVPTKADGKEGSMSSSSSISCLLQVKLSLDQRNLPLPTVDSRLPKRVKGPWLNYRGLFHVS